VGDTNDDGRAISGRKGLVEQPAARRRMGLQQFDLTDRAFPSSCTISTPTAMLIWGIGHNYGLYWSSRRDATGGHPSKHAID
jgi:hypothetical protein